MRWLVLSLILVSSLAGAQSGACAAYYPQYCSEGKCEAPECEIYADGSGGLLLPPAQSGTLDLNTGIVSGASNADTLTYSTDGSDWFIDNSETHGDVVCTKDGDGLLQCGVAPTFGDCPDGYLKAEYSNGWPTTCWAPSADSDPGIIISIGDLAPDSPRSFNRLETSTSNPARTGTLMATARIPDAPSAARPPSVADRPHVTAGCGPAWLGGCWDVHRPQRTYAETFKSPLFYAPFFGLLAANAIDIEATRASGCGEAHEFGKKPTRLEQYGQDFAADAAVGTLAFFLHRAHIKVIPQAMLGYGIGIHIHGAIKGFQATCR